MKKKRRQRQRGKHPRMRRLSRRVGVCMVLALIMLSIAGEWFVHHPRRWVAKKIGELPTFVTAPLLWIGNPISDLTDALDLTGHDAVYEYDIEAPKGEVFFAGAPKRIGEPAPNDIRILDRGEFVIGWSDRLRHPLWVAYHVTPDAKYPADYRPGFIKDRSVAAAPSPNDYTKGGYDRGHMAPNYAIVSRYGADEQRKTFMMSNISPQTAALNRGVWRNVEHRIAELWTAKYGEIWVVVGAIPGNGEKLGRTEIDVPKAYYQIVMAQVGMNVRALAVLFPQHIPWNTYAARNLVTIDELEELTGLDFNPEMPSFIADPLESELPDRLWPICPSDLLKLFLSSSN